MNFNLFFDKNLFATSGPKLTPAPRIEGAIPNKLTGSDQSASRTVFQTMSKFFHGENARFYLVVGDTHSDFCSYQWKYHTRHSQGHFLR